jgi:hypothetical protein
LFHNDGARLSDVSETAGPAFQQSFPARGLAIGDYDNDGLPDVLIGNNGARPVLLRNNTAQRNHWLGIKLVCKTSNRDAIGARLAWSVGGVTYKRLKNNGGSYLSSHDLREIIGTGKASKLDWLEIKWPAPSKQVDRFTSLPIDRYVTITEGGKLEG